MALLRLSCGFNEIRGFDLFFRGSTLEKGTALNDAHHVDQVSELRDSTQQVSKYSGRCLSQVKISQRCSVWIQVSKLLKIWCSYKFSMSIKNKLRAHFNA